MVELIIVGERPTEERFVTDVLKDILALNGIYATPRLIKTSPQGKGGGLNLDRVRRFVVHTLRERTNTFVTTLFDLYGLDPSFRGVEDTKNRTPSERAQAIEAALHADIVESAQCRPERFLPHIQPHEFEALLFSDVHRLCEIEPTWAASAPQLAEIRNAKPDPEWINDSRHTAPSKRLEILNPNYRKTMHGPRSAKHIGLDRIRQECPHFGRWFERLLALKPL
ncbi:DUF4276 family protein [Burkholderia sp. 22PA0106]|uniref:DUF4276 family protein n=1 Tax=Burkholderia sp. 22PA0106 TaxID=3237371 RepID=UPI0039C3AA20